MRENGPADIQWMKFIYNTHTTDEGGSTKERGLFIIKNDSRTMRIGDFHYRF